MPSPKNTVEDQANTSPSDAVPPPRRPAVCWGLNPDYVKQVEQENKKIKAAKIHPMDDVSEESLVQAKLRR